MPRSDFYREMRQRADPLWKAVFEHPFVRGIGDGSLARDRFEFYLKQDYLYLMDFNRVFALAGAKSRILEEMETFASLLNATLKTEMELHRKTCAAFGIPAHKLTKTRKGMITTAYTDFLLRTSYEGGLSEILAVLSPCACGYAEIGQSLGAGKLPNDPFYRDWIRTYSSREFLDLANWLAEKTNEHARGASPKRREDWYRLYETSARFEYLFFDMSWKKEEWPTDILAPPGASDDGR